MSIAWAVTDESTADRICIAAKHVSGERIVMYADNLTVWAPRAIPLDVIDEMRKLRDQHADEQVDERAQI